MLPYLMMLLSSLGPNWWKDRMNSSMLSPSHSYAYVHIRAHRYRCRHRHTYMKGKHFQTWNIAQWQSIVQLTVVILLEYLLPHVGSGDWTQIIRLGYQGYITTTTRRLVCCSATRGVMWISLWGLMTAAGTSQHSSLSCKTYTVLKSCCQSFWFGNWPSRLPTLTSSTHTNSLMVIG